jgi:hypothetical protein
VRAVRRFFARLRNLATVRRGGARLREEIDAHIAMQTEENLKARMNSAEARREAVLRFGAVPAISESGL